MDPQFRKLLEHSWKAVEDSGYISSQNSRNSSFLCQLAIKSFI
ncbi:beta-ketoacyl synthase N-terminal-like domain-containing protein [Candidatus Profftella armatura]